MGAKRPSLNSLNTLLKSFRREIKMSDIENRPPTSVLTSKSGPKDGITKPKDKTIKPKEKLSGSERKKLQTLQPSSKNQALLVGSDGQLRLGQKKEVIVFKDPTPAATSTPERKVTVSRVETAVQVSPRLVEGSTQVEEADTAVAKAQAFMYGEEEPDIDYWKQLAEKRREALETSLLENEELHTSLSAVEEEKEAIEKERDNLKEMAEQAEELAKIVKSLVPDEEEEDNSEEEDDGSDDEEEKEEQKAEEEGN